jgi:hypothetical protein
MILVHTKFYKRVTESLREEAVSVVRDLRLKRGVE